jgi:hypothetical protein
MTRDRWAAGRGALCAISTALCAFGAGASATQAADWSTTEIQYEGGKLDNPFAGGSTYTNIVTLQHASGYSFGDVFFFVDLSDDGEADGYNDKDAYGEFYAYFSSSKILGAKYPGPLKDIGVVLGVNYGADSDYLSYLPGAYLDWNAPGFAFLRTQVTAVIDDSGPLITQGDGWQFDISWGLPFQIGGQYFSFEGHAEYTGTEIEDWFLAQPQLRWDAGYAFTGKKDVFFLGTEYQYWNNKLGTDVDESAFQALAVWRF